VVPRDGVKWSYGQGHRKEKEEGSGTGKRRRGPYLGREVCTWIFVQGPIEFLVTPLLMGPVCLLSQGWFEKPVLSTFSCVDFV